MLISSSVNMNITNRNKAYYINKGYRIDKINQVIEIQVTDLPKRSNAIVNVQCDYCFQIKKVKYSRFQILNPDGIR